MNRPAAVARAAALPAVSNRILLMGGAVMAAVALLAAAPAAFAQSQPVGGAPLTIQAVTERPSLNLSAYGEVKTAPLISSRRLDRAGGAAVRAMAVGRVMAVRTPEGGSVRCARDWATTVAAPWPCAPE